ncbi:MAG: hypothetical protein IBJ18_11200 [Phycisphaerales bacterium]|nr:hypothetical protein [Phycisphaerales bacterium]
MPAAAGTPKTCVHCKQDCSTRPRVRDAQGQYACKDCLTKLGLLNADGSVKAQTTSTPAAAAPKVVVKSAAVPKSAAVAAPVPAGKSAGSGFDNPDDDGIDLSSFRSDPSVGQSVAANWVTCPGCGSPAAKDATLCLTCGTNIKTGKKSKTKVAGPGADFSKVDDAAIKSNPLLWVLGAGAGAFLGALGIYAIYVGTGNIFLISAVGVGFLAGVGAAIVARDKAGAATGFIAALFTIIGVIGARQWCVYETFGNTMTRLTDPNMSDEDYKLFDGMMYANAAALAAAETPRAPTRRGRRSGPEFKFYKYYADLPGDAKAIADAAFAELTPAEVVQEKRRVADTFSENSKYFSVAYQFSVLDFVWVAVGVSVAFGIGSQHKS